MKNPSMANQFMEMPKETSSESLAEILSEFSTNRPNY